METINKVLNPETGDLIRETIIVIVGLIIRWLEKRKIKNDTL